MTIRRRTTACPSRRRIAATLFALASLACGPAAPHPSLPAADYSPRPFPELSVPAARAAAVREEALTRAKVWEEPAVPIERADLVHDPRGAPVLPDDLVCRYFERQAGGTTPKFHCLLPGGEVIKVKYGTGNAEVFAEIAASRLARALGFGADEMHFVRTVDCFGCPRTGASWLDSLLSRGRPVRYRGVAVERRVPGKEIVAGNVRGWAWFELDKIQETRGGASPAERDALRLMAVLLAHWDNKAENQRLVCRPDADDADGGCRSSFAFMQDVGGTFGPRKVDLGRWRAAPIWADVRTCRVSLKTMPYEGGTFPDATIGEPGRLLLGGLLGRLTVTQMTDLFRGAHFPEYSGHARAARDVGAWVAALDDKIRQIRDRPPCP